jgi:FkbM family methyltransferase
MIRKSRSGDFWVLEGDIHMSAWAEMSGRLDHDQNSLPRILPHVPVGGTVVDGGAYIGTHTIAYLEKVGPEGTVFAFEPNPEAFSALKLNCPRAHSYQVALHDVRGKGDLLPPRDTNYGATAVIENFAGDVEMVTLDSMLIGVERLDFIKLDLEGNELHALKGAAETIKRFKPVIVCEVNVNMLDLQNTSPEELLAYICSIGYSYRNIYDRQDCDGPQFDVICKPIS